MKYGDLILYNKFFSFRTSIIILSVCTSFIAGFLFVQENVLAQLLLIITTGFTIVYAIPIYKEAGLRYVPVLKIPLVAISWVFLLFMYPLLSVYNAGALNNLTEFDSVPFLGLRMLQYVFLIMALCIPFEIRDLKYDEQSLRTLPQLIGVKASKIVGILLLAGTLILELLWGGSKLFLSYPALLIVVITATCIWLSDYFKSDCFSSFFVEGIPVLWLFFLYVK